MDELRSARAANDETCACSGTVRIVRHDKSADLHMLHGDDDYMVLSSAIGVDVEMWNLIVAGEYFVS